MERYGERLCLQAKWVLIHLVQKYGHFRRLQTTPTKSVHIFIQETPSFLHLTNNPHVNSLLVHSGDNYWSHPPWHIRTQQGLGTWQIPRPRWKAAAWSASRHPRRGWGDNCWTRLSQGSSRAAWVWRPPYSPHPLPPSTDRNSPPAAILISYRSWRQLETYIFTFSQHNSSPSWPTRCKKSLQPVPSLWMTEQ